MGKALLILYQFFLVAVTDKIKAKKVMDKEPEIGLGGANFNADPIGARELLYPIAVVLSGDRLSQYETLQKKLGLTDIEILLRFHPCFALTVYGEVGTI